MTTASKTSTTLVADPLDWQQQLIDQLDWHWQGSFPEPKSPPLTTIAGASGTSASAALDFLDQQYAAWIEGVRRLDLYRTSGGGKEWSA